MGNSDGFVLNGKVYDFLKWVALVVLPAVATLYFALGQIWAFPAVEQVVGTVTALDTFLGLLLKRSSTNYESLSDRPRIMGDFVVKVNQDGDATGMLIKADQEFIPTEGELIAFRAKREVEPS